MSQCISDLVDTRKKELNIFEKDLIEKAHELWTRSLDKNRFVDPAIEMRIASHHWEQWYKRECATRVDMVLQYQYGSLYQTEYPACLLKYINERIAIILENKTNLLGEQQ